MTHEEYLYQKLFVRDKFNYLLNIKVQFQEPSIRSLCDSQSTDEGSQVAPFMSYLDKNGVRVTVDEQDGLGTWKNDRFICENRWTNSYNNCKYNGLYSDIIMSGFGYDVTKPVTREQETMLTKLKSKIKLQKSQTMARLKAYFSITEAEQKVKYEHVNFKPEKIDFYGCNPVKTYYIPIKRNFTKDWVKLLKMAAENCTSEKFHHVIDSDYFELFSHFKPWYTVPSNPTYKTSNTFPNVYQAPPTEKQKLLIKQASWERYQVWKIFNIPH